MSAVLDASVTLTWCFLDQTTPETDQLLDHVATLGAVVPTLWFTEVANVLVQAARRNRITAADLTRRLDLISSLPILVDQTGPAHAWSTTLHLAQTHNLTAYDATYLELSLRRTLPLFTLDHALATAAHRLGIPVSPQPHRQQQGG